MLLLELSCHVPRLSPPRAVPFLISKMMQSRFLIQLATLENVCDISPTLSVQHGVQGLMCTSDRKIL